MRGAGLTTHGHPRRRSSRHAHRNPATPSGRITRPASSSMIGMCWGHGRPPKEGAAARPGAHQAWPNSACARPGHRGSPRDVRLLRLGPGAGQPIEQLTLAAGTDHAVSGPAGAVRVLAGVHTNFIWCLILILRNRSAGRSWAGPVRTGTPNILADAPRRRCCATSLSRWGYLWYFQFFFYTMA